MFSICDHVKMNQQFIHDKFKRLVVSLITRKSTGVVNKFTGNDEIVNITDTFRWFRNNSPQLNEDIKQELLNLGLIDMCLWFCENHFVNHPLSCSILLQFLSNFSINYKIAQSNIYDYFHNTLR